MSKTGRDHQSLEDLLRDFVREAEEAYPFLRGKLVLYDVPRNTYYVSPYFNAKRRGFKDKAEVGEYIANHETAQIARGDDARALADRDHDRNIFMIFFNHDIKPAEALRLPAWEMRAVCNTLDHELGHLVIPDALYGDVPGVETSDHGMLAAENMAEAYAHLRHYQRFGTAAPAPDASALELARGFVMQERGLASHYYYPTIREIEAMRHKIDFAALSPVDLARLARRFAVSYTPSDAVVAEMDRAFAPCRGAYRRHGTAAAMRVLVDIVEKTPSPHVARLGIDVGLYCLQTASFGLQGAEWNDARARLKKVEILLARDSLLFGLADDKTPLKAPPRRRRKTPPAP